MCPLIGRAALWGCRPSDAPFAKREQYSAYLAIFLHALSLRCKLTHIYMISVMYGHVGARPGDFDGRADRIGQARRQTAAVH